MQPGPCLWRPPNTRCGQGRGPITLHPCSLGTGTREVGRACDARNEIIELTCTHDLIRNQFYALTVMERSRDRKAISNKMRVSRRRRWEPGPWRRRGLDGWLEPWADGHRRGRAVGTCPRPSVRWWGADPRPQSLLGSHRACSPGKVSVCYRCSVPPADRHRDAGSDDC